MSVITDLEQEFANLVEKGKAEAETILSDVYQEALLLEAKAKTEIVLLRQRAANLASDAEVEAEKLVIEAKLFLDKVLNWIKELEAKLSTSPHAVDYSTGQNTAEGRHHGK